MNNNNNCINYLFEIQPSSSLHVIAFQVLMHLSQGSILQESSFKLYSCIYENKAN